MYPTSSGAESRSQSLRMICQECGERQGSNCTPFHDVRIRKKSRRAGASIGGACVAISKSDGARARAHQNVAGRRAHEFESQRLVPIRGVGVFLDAGESLEARKRSDISMVEPDGRYHRAANSAVPELARHRQPRLPHAGAAFAQATGRAAQEQQEKLGERQPLPRALDLIKPPHLTKPVTFPEPIHFGQMSSGNCRQ